MFGSSILDVAIGMAFVYLLLSLVASAALEGLSAMAQARAANLEHGIRSLFSGGKLDDHYFVDLIYKHGLVRGLYQDPKLDKPDRADPDTSPTRKIRRGVAFLRKLLGVKPSEITRDISDPYLLPSYIPARTFAMSLIDILNPDKQNGVPLENIAKKLGELCKAADDKAPNKAAEALLALLADAGNAADAAVKFRCNVENWYNDAMDRVSGWYKKHTQWILLVIGLSLAIFFNVDSIRVAKTLWFDRSAREGLVAAATTYTKNNPVLASSTDPKDAKKLAENMQDTVEAFQQTTETYLIPVGWHYSFADYRYIFFHPQEKWEVLHILEQVTGWCVTALAISLGAPFWFDTLNKIMVIRSTVKPQEKSRNEPSKD